MAALVGLTFVAASCISFQREPPATTRYLLQLDDLGPSGDKVSSDRAIEVRPFRAAAAYGGRQFVYRVGATEVETDFYHELLIPPARSITEATAEWLARDGGFARVLDAGSAGDGEWIVEGDLTALYADYRSSERAAVMELHLAVLERGGARAVLDRRYAARVALVADSADALVAGWRECLRRILTEWSVDLDAVQ